MYDVDSRAVAMALVVKLARCKRRIEKKKAPTPAEKRRLLRLRTVKALRDGNWND